MRFLVVADLHYSLPQFDWLVSAAPQFDLVIFAGDALDIGSMVDFRAQIVVVKKYLAMLAGQTRVILCSGNHDLDERNAEGEKIARWISDVRELGIACDGDDLTIGDTLFTVCPDGTGRGSSSALPISFAMPPPAGRRDGSGRITPRPRIRRRVGAASASSATSSSCNGSCNISLRW
jgi:3',5'-cyclic AMP phosphodiesterase CpdA